MAQKIDVGVESDHIEAMTRSNGINALSELIWNALDADATQVDVDYVRDKMDSITTIKIRDNGHGLNYNSAKRVYSKLGGSVKKTQNLSPGGRAYHGKEGKGRYKSLALGDLVTMESWYKEGDQIKNFRSVLDRNNISFTELSDVTSLPKGQGQAGFEVVIENVNHENVNHAIDIKQRKELEQKLAAYWISYPDFTILFNGNPLQFDSLIKHSEQKELNIQDGNLTYKVVIKVVEWNIEIKRKLYLCNIKGVPFSELNPGFRSSIPISLFIQSVYIETLHKENRLDLATNEGELQVIINEGRKFARDYLRRRLQEFSSKYIEELKFKGLYPYKGKPDNVIEESTQQVFDILALQVHEYMPDFDKQDDKSKKLTLTLIKEALENDSSSLKRILSEVIELPEDKRDELAEILDDTPLSAIIDTMAEVKNRLNLLNGLEQIIYDKDLNKNIKERKHLHKIVAKETWIFGDSYTFGVDDVTLKNVLKAYIKDGLQREDFQEIIDGADNSELTTIPDVCLWHQYSVGSAGKENLVIELKKPSVDAGFTEKTQIESYATKVANDSRFPKNKTRWKFLLVTKEVKQEIAPLMQQHNRAYGHIAQGDNFDVFILEWGHILTEAKVRHEYIRDKLKLNFQDNNHGLDYLHKKYSEYLPSDFNGEDLKELKPAIKVKESTPQKKSKTKKAT